ncbi:DUF4197 domain-containing protein [Caldimonas sp. KR1-144]|uniref:DUF4197 domain-containing protein n=1 Tax=Caldimonas sp. KR1-144 TaxID=3400911 RepID=UPI003C0B79E3
MRKFKTSRRKCMAQLAAGAGVGWWLLAAHRQAWALSFSDADASAGVREALSRGAESAVALLGRQDGFLGNPKVRIPLPKGLDSAARLLKSTGQGEQVEQLETAMNRAAEAAVPEAGPLLSQAVKQMTVTDARKIVTGGDTSVTQFFASKTRAPLTERFLPIVTRATEKVSLAAKYNAVAGTASGFGLIKKKDANIQQYVTGKSLDGLYFMIGEEERKIRRDPIGTGSEILKKVFG